MRRLILTSVTTLVVAGLVSAASASATVTPSCIPTSNTPFTITVPGITAAEQPYLGVIWAQPPFFSPLTRGVLSNETFTSSGLTATATFPAGLPSVMYDVAVTISQPPQALDAGSISVGCAATRHSTSTTLSCTPALVSPADQATCDAVVTDTASSGPTSPTGTIIFSSTAQDTFSSNPCPVQGASTTTAVCTVRVDSLALGPQTITADYTADATHNPSSGTGSLAVAAPGGDTKGCSVTFKGQITAESTGDLAHIAGSASGAGPSGRERYRDRGPGNPFLFVSQTISDVSCPQGGRTASVYGTGSLASTGQTESYRIDVATGEHATYRIRLSNGYDSGVAKLNFGRIDITRGG